MADILTADERAAIAAYPEELVQRVPRGVSGEAQYTWIANRKGGLRENLVADRPAGWRAERKGTWQARLARLKRGRAAGLKAKQDKAAARLPHVRRLRDEGLTNAEIAAFLGVSLATIGNDLAALRKEGQAVRRLNSGVRKLTDDQVAALRAAYRAGEPFRALMRRAGYGSADSFSRVLRGVSYGHVPGAIEPHEMRSAKGEGR